MKLNKKIYFFDKGIFNPYRMSNVELKVNQAVKENKIFFTEEEPWEIRFDNSYPNVFYDDLAGVYRCYYSTFTDDVESEKYSLEERKRANIVLRQVVLFLFVMPKVKTVKLGKTKPRNYRIPWVER